MARDLAREADDPFIGAKVRRVPDPTMTAPEAEARAGMASIRREVASYLPEHGLPAHEQLAPGRLREAIIGDWESPFLNISVCADGTLNTTSSCAAAASALARPLTRQPGAAASTRAAASCARPCSREPIVGQNKALVTVNGLFRPFALAGGRAVATWKIATREVVLEPFARITRADDAALRDEADDVLRYLAPVPGGARLGVRA